MIEVRWEGARCIWMMDYSGFNFVARSGTYGKDFWNETPVACIHFGCIRYPNRFRYVDEMHFLVVIPMLLHLPHLPSLLFAQAREEVIHSKTSNTRVF